MLPTTLPALVDWLSSAPAGTTLDAAQLLALLTQMPESNATPTMPVPESMPDGLAAPWSERIWTTHAETRLGVREAAEAIRRPTSFVYRHTSAKCAAGERLPYRKLDGELLFVAGELRTWLADHEEVVNAGRISSQPLTLNRRAG